MDRNAFIRDLIAALQDNDDLAKSGAQAPLTPVAAQQAPGALFAPTRGHATSADSLSREAYECLQFDFPQVSEAALDALADAYRTAAEQRRRSSFAFPVTATLLDALAYLNDHGVGTTTARSPAAAGPLAAAVLLVLFRNALQCPTDASMVAALAPLRVPRKSDVSSAQQQERTRALAQFEARDTLLEVDSDASATAKQDDADSLEEIFAEQEDPDDLSLVYEGELPTRRWTPPPAAPYHPVQSHTDSVFDKLCWMSQRTYSSLFTTVTADRWAEWGLDATLVDIIRVLLSQHNDATGTSKLFGIDGEWTKYLYLLRDRVLQAASTVAAPATAFAGLATLQQVLGLVKACPVQSPPADLPPTYLVFRVLAELAMAKEMSVNRRAEAELVRVVLALLPDISQELTKLATEQDPACADFVVVLLQLIQFAVTSTSNPTVVVEKMQDTGLLRTVLMLVPQVDKDVTQESIVQSSWFTLFARLLGTCSLWSEEVASYVSRVRKLVVLWPQMEASLPAETFLLAFSFHIHKADAAVESKHSQPWNLRSHAPDLVPTTCGTFLESMRKVQDAIFVLDTILKAWFTFKPASQEETEAQVRAIYPMLTGAFTYPDFQAVSAVATNDSIESVKGEDRDRGNAEASQLVAARNRLRQCAKMILLAPVSSNARNDRNAGSATISSKLD